MSELAIIFPTKKTKQKQQQNLLSKAEQTKEHAQTGAMALTKSWVSDPYKKREKGLVERKKRRVSQEHVFPSLILVGGEAASNVGVQSKFVSHPHSPAVQLFKHRAKFPFKTTNLRAHMGDSVL
jgi:hypothetical protein